MAISKIVYKSSSNATPVTWMDATSATASAADITSPKTAMLADGVMTTGTGAGGASNSNMAEGTFTGSASEKGGIKTLSIAYSGNGYPVSLQIFPAVGSYKNGSSAYTSTQKSAMFFYAMSKSDTGTAPDWGNNAEKNQGVVCAVYKNSYTDATAISTSTAKETRIFTTQNPTGTYSVNAVKFYDKNTMKVWIADTDEFGFMPEVEYTFYIVYSS